jgi:hypothetical protein
VKMIFFVLSLLVSFFSNCAVQPSGFLFIRPYEYTNDSLIDLGSSMQYRPLQIDLNDCPNTLTLCSTALRYRDWWTTALEPQHSIYMRPLLAIQNPFAILNSMNNQRVGSFCLFIMKWQLQKLISSLSCITHYQVAIARNYTYNEEEDNLLNRAEALPLSMLFDLNHLRNIQPSYSGNFDPQFFNDLENEIKQFDNAVCALAHQRSNGSIKSGLAHFNEFMSRFEKVIIQYHGRKTDSTQRISDTCLWRLLICCTVLFPYIFKH